MKKTWHIPALVFIYFALALAGALNHELWLDEAQHILLARDSASFSSLIHNARYEGHPIFWNILLYLVLKITNSVFCIQLLNVLISTACAYLILKHSPYSILVRLCIVLGYFMIYEYSVLSRSYALSLLFFLLFLIIISRERKNFVLIAALFAVLCNTHLFSWLLCIAFLPTLRAGWEKAGNRIRVISGVIALAGLAPALLQIIPPQGHFWHEYNGDNLLSMSRFRKVVFVPVKGLLPVPDFFKLNYWNSNLLIDLSSFFAAFVSLLLFALPFLFFRHRARLLFLFYFPVAGVIAFMFLTPLMLTNRNCGFISLALLGVTWVSSGDPENSGRLKKLYLSSVVIAQLAAGIFVYAGDLTKEFSNAKSAAAFIMKYSAITGSKPVLLTHQSAGPSLSLYSSRNFFYLESNKTGSFCDWSTFPMIAKDSVLLQRIRPHIKEQESTMLVTNQRRKIIALDSLNTLYTIIPGLKIRELQTFDNAVVGSENYFIYSLSR